MVSLPMMDVSSTEVRRRVAAGESIAGLVPEAVASYIERRQLYR
jgi:nicotinate-nucleotide adenylyltransferase